MWNSSTVMMIVEGTFATIYMTLLSTLMAYVIGLPVGVALVVTGREGLGPNAAVNKVLDVIVNITRSIPFLILLILVIPLTRAIVGKSYGPSATVVPLTLAAAPFVARMIESSLKEVDAGVIEAAESMGSTRMQIIFKVLLPEAKPSITVGMAITIVTILGYSAMAGFVGGGGLGAIAINYGYYRYDYQIMLITVVLIVIIVQIFQELFMRIATKTDKRINK